MADPLVEWHEEHARFGRLLTLLEGETMAFHAGEQPNYDLMRDIVHYLRHVADRFHHPREDVAFARLAERNPDLRISINRLLQEHRVIACTGEALLQRLDDIAADVVVERSAVEAAAVTYILYYRHHLAIEEAEIMPLAGEILKPDDWRAVAAAVPGGPDPLFGENVAARYEALRKRVIAEPAPV